MSRIWAPRVQASAPSPCGFRLFPERRLRLSIIATLLPAVTLAGSTLVLTLCLFQQKVCWVLGMFLQSAEHCHMESMFPLSHWIVCHPPWRSSLERKRMNVASYVSAECFIPNPCRLLFCISCRCQWEGVVSALCEPNSEVESYTLV